MDYFTPGESALIALHHSFSLVLVPPPRRKHSKQRSSLPTYLSFLSITLVPAILLVCTSKDERGWYSALLSGGLVYIAGPFAQSMGLVALWAQARETIVQHEKGSLSIDVLFAQAFVFLLVGISFIFRLRLRAEHWKYCLSNALRSWHWLVGWAKLNNLIYALAQGILRPIALRQNRGVRAQLEPLLL